MVGMPEPSVDMGMLIVHPSTHLDQKEEGNVLFNDALNTFYFTVIWRQTYG